jgi:hypothetical protein
VTALVLLTCGCQNESLKRWHDVTVLDVAGQPIQPLADAPAHAATVLIFITDDCPISNAYAPDINAIVTEYSPRNVVFYVAYVDPGLSDAAARKHAADFGYTCPIVVDRQHELVKAVGAGITPEAAVISPGNELAYRGRIDDRYVDFGKKRLAPGRQDLRIALDAVLAGERVSVHRTDAVGCFIPDVPEESE